MHNQQHATNAALMQFQCAPMRSHFQLSKSRLEGRLLQALRADQSRTLLWPESNLAVSAGDAGQVCCSFAVAVTGIARACKACARRTLPARGCGRPHKVATRSEVACHR
eukprot:6187744-Pleurochrysis_carterae.AAC.11